MLNEFDFEIKYIKGKEKRVANTLSLRVQLNCITSISSYGTDLEERIKEWINKMKNVNR